ncbi:phosphatase, partial [Klebsiella quasipneumoniae]|nr:phosphatase [Klebsiella quasipneumoniae]
QRVATQIWEVIVDAAAGVVSGVAAGCGVIAVNAPADTPRLADVDFALDSLTQLSVAKQPNGDVVVLRKT